MGITGTEDQPARAGMSVSDVSTGIYAALLVLAAVQERARSGRGRHLDVAMFDVTTEFLAPMLVSYLNAGVRYPRLPDRHHAIAPYGVFHCADGRPVLLAIQQDAEWALLCRHVLGRDDLAADERFRDNAARLANRDEVDGLVGRAIGALGFDEAVALLERCGFAYAALNEVADVAAHPVLAERGIVQEVQGSGGPVQTTVGIAERLFGAGPPRRARPPGLGEDSEEILRELGRRDR
jgi:itaconate CoA-transferase